MITKIRTASTFILFWQAPEPVASGTEPVLVVKAGGAAVAGIPDLTVVAGPATISTVPTGGGKVLTASAPVATSDRATIDAGEAFYLSDEDGARVCRVRSIDGASVTVTEPFTPIVHPGGVLQWARWWTKLSAADATATARRDLTWEVTFRPAHPGSAEGENGTRTDGPHQFIVCDKPFDTRLTTPILHGALAELGQSIPARDSDRSGIIALALSEMIGDIRADVRALRRWEDDLDGAGFLLPHKLLCASYILERTDAERAAQLRARYASTLATALKVSQVDLDGDGVPDEEPTPLRGAIDLAPASMSSILAAAPTLPRWATLRF